MRLPPLISRLLPSGTPSTPDLVPAVRPFESPVGMDRFGGTRSITAAVALSTALHFSVPIGRGISSTWYGLQAQLSETLDRVRLPDDKDFQMAKRDLALRIRDRVLRWQADKNEPISELGRLLTEVSVFTNPETAAHWKTTREKAIHRWTHRNDDLPALDPAMSPMHKALWRAYHLRTPDRLGHWEMNVRDFNGCFFENEGCNCYLRSTSVASDLLEFKDAMIPKGYELLLQSYAPWQVRAANPFLAVGHMRPVLYLNSGDYKTGVVAQLIERERSGPTNTDLFHPVFSLHRALENLDVDGITSPLKKDEWIVVRVPEEEKGYWDTTRWYMPERSVTEAPRPDAASRSDYKAHAELVTSVLREAMTVEECCQEWESHLDPDSPLDCSEGSAIKNLPLNRGESVIDGPQQLTINGYVQLSRPMPRNIKCFQTKLQKQRFSSLQSDEQRQAFLLELIGQFREETDFARALAFLASPHTAIATMSPAHLEAIFALIRDIESNHLYVSAFLKYPPAGMTGATIYTDATKKQLAEADPAWRAFYSNLDQLREWARTHPLKFVVYLNALPKRAKRDFIGLFRHKDIEPAYGLIKSQLRVGGEHHKETVYKADDGPQPVNEVLIDVDVIREGSRELHDPQTMSNENTARSSKKYVMEEQLTGRTTVTHVSPETILALALEADSWTRLLEDNYYGDFEDMYSETIWTAQVSEALLRNFSRREYRSLFEALMWHLLKKRREELCRPEVSALVHSQLPQHMIPLYETYCRLYGQ